MKYADYLQKDRELSNKKKLQCEHQFDRPVYYRKCTCCGAYIPFRMKSDVEYRGAICEEHDIIIIQDEYIELL